MKPSVGRIVHYVAKPGSPCGAAIITSVGLGLMGHLVMPPDVAEPVSLTVFPGAVSLGPVGYDESKHERTWHWPERVEG